MVAAESSLGLAMPEDDNWVWDIDLAEEATERLTLWLRLPDVPEPTDVNITLLAGDGGDPTEQTLTIDVVQHPDLAEALSELEVLASQRRIYRKAYQRLKTAARALAKDQNLWTAHELVKTSELLIRISTVEAEQLRAAVAEALQQVSQELAEW
ncbi:MAG: hypothetical protein OEU26_27895 [Candidatus Tectomicrobia bacterium]|nr:hypothetical protein [Candidatus Tectomicrobia bacterium]